MCVQPPPDHARGRAAPACRGGMGLSGPVSDWQCDQWMAQATDSLHCSWHRTFWTFTMSITAFVQILINMFWTLLTLLSFVLNRLMFPVGVVWQLFWIFEFHKVMEHHNKGEVEIAIIATQSVFLGICRWKNFQNWLTLLQLWPKNKVAVFFWNTVRCSGRCKMSCAKRNSLKCRIISTKLSTFATAYMRLVI